LHREVSAAGPALRVNGNASKNYDDIDRLAADIAVLIKEQDEEFGSEREIQSWLDEAGIEYEDRALSMALRQLEDTGE
jgi:repressor of nif and glnA expression